MHRLFSHFGTLGELYTGYADAGTSLNDPPTTAIGPQYFGDFLVVTLLNNTTVF